MARSAAWSLPVVAVAAASPARAASCQPALIRLLSPAGGNGYDVRLADGKVRPNATTNYLASGFMATLTFAVTDQDGTPRPGLTASVSCDGSVVDDEGNAMLRFAPVGSRTQSEAPGASTAEAVTDPQGRFTVWAATATYRRQDRVINPALDNHGQFTVAVAPQGDACATAANLTFQVVDASPYAGI